MKTKTEKDNLELLVGSFTTSTGNFLLKKLLVDWYSVSELTKLWKLYKNPISLPVLATDPDPRTLDLKNIKEEKTNPRVWSLVNLWYSNNLLYKQRVKKEFKRVKNNKVHLYPSVRERYKLNIAETFTVCIKYLLKNHYNSRIEFYKYCKQNKCFKQNKTIENYYNKRLKEELEYYENKLRELEDMKEDLKHLLENDKIKSFLFHDWLVFHPDSLFGLDLVQVVKKFLIDWKNVLGLRRFLPNSTEKLLDKDMEKAVEKIVKNSSFVQTVLNTKHGKETLETVIKPEVRLIIWFLTHRSGFLDYLFEKEDMTGNTFQHALYYFNILDFKFGKHNSF